MNRRTVGIEIMVGLLMIAGGLALFFLAMKVSNLSGLQTTVGYYIDARFDNIGSLKVRSPVTMSGVKVGEVSAINYDDISYEAVVTMAISPKFDQIPDDTFAKVLTQGILGEQYIGLDPGGSEVYLQEGGEITVTQSAMILEEIIGQFLFTMAEKGSGAD